MELMYKFTSKQIISQGRTTEEHIETLRTWLIELEDKNVPKRIQDESLILFLLSCRNDIELTKRTIISYYKCMKNGPELHDGRDLERDDIKRCLNTLHFSTLPVRTDENYAIHFCKMHDTYYGNFDLLPLLKLSLMLIDITLEENPPDGLVVLIDMKGFGLMHLMKLRLSPMMKYFQYVQEGIPLQIRAIHVINSVYFMDKVMAFLKLCIKGELFNLIQVHPSGMSEEKLFEILPKKCLPAEYGGDLPSAKVLHEIALEQMKEKQEFWTLEEKLRKECK